MLSNVHDSMLLSFPADPAELAFAKRMLLAEWMAAWEPLSAYTSRPIGVDTRSCRGRVQPPDASEMRSRAAFPLREW